MRKFFWLFILFSISAKAQITCDESRFQKTPNSWVFGTYTIQGNTSKLNDSCNTYVNGKPYRLSYYSDGMLMYSCSYDISTGKKNNEFKRYLKDKPTYPNDTLIGELKQFYPNGKLQSHNIYYYSTEFPNTRWVRSIHYHLNEKKRYVEHDVYPHAPDSLAKAKPNIYDALGFSTSSEKCGWHEDYDQEGNLLKREYYKLNGVYPEGISSNLEFSENYYANGKLQERGNYKNGQKDGKWISYHYSGEIASVEHFKYGQHSGRSFWFSPQGDTIGYKFQSGIAYEEMQFYGKGKPVKKRRVDEYGNGYELCWYENGVLKHDIQLQNNRAIPNGCGTFWHPDGTIQKKFPCIIENNDTTFFERYPDGKLKELRIEIQGDKNIRTTYFPGEKIQEESITYASGEIASTLKQFNEKGICVFEMTFFRALNRKEIKRFENGTTKSELHFNKENVLDGTCIGYYENGKIKFQGNYKEGLRDGAFEYFGPTENLIYKNTYNKGIPANKLNPPLIKKNDCKPKGYGFAVCDSLQNAFYPIAKNLLKGEFSKMNKTKLFYSTQEIDSIVQILSAVYHFSGKLFPTNLGHSEQKTDRRSLYFTLSGLYQHDEKSGKMIPNESYLKLKKIAGEFKVELLDSCVKSGGYYYVFAHSDVIPNLLLLNEKLQKENLNAWIYDHETEKIGLYRQTDDRLSCSIFQGFPLIQISTIEPGSADYLSFSVLVYPDGTCEFFRHEEPIKQQPPMKWDLYRD